MGMASDPRHLSKALSDLIALKGLVRVRGEGQLASIWSGVAGPEISRQTKVLGINRGVLRIGVSNAPLLSELVSFRKTSLLKVFQEEHADLKIRDLKFRLKGTLLRP